MLRNQLGHLEHVYHILTAKYLLELGVRVDISLILLVLKVVLLNVDPKRLDHLRAGHRALAHHLCQICAYVHRLHKC